MPWFPHTAEDRAAMLRAVGLRTVEELFAPIPAPQRRRGAPPLPAARSEDELAAELHELASWNTSGEKGAFLGGGCARRFVPAAVDALAEPFELAAAEAPSAPEAAQGTLTALFELQTMLAALFAAEVASAGFADGASAAAQALALAHRLAPERGRVVVSRGVHPHTRACLRARLRWLPLELVEAPLDERGRTMLEGLLDERCCALFVQSPNFLGALEEQGELARAARAVGALSVASVDPLALALLKPPAEAGFDVAVADGQGLGAPLALGGATFGILATRAELLDLDAGALVGQTVDARGERGFAPLAPSARHARAALRGAIYLAMAGAEGLREVAEHVLARTQHAADEIARLPGYALPCAAAGSFGELLVRCPAPARLVNRALDAAGLVGGVDLAPFYPERGERELLLAFTEGTRREHVVRLTRTLAAAADLR